MDPTFFATPQAFRAWLEANHETATELSVGFRKRSTGLASITWPQAVDQALCFGWIDRLRPGDRGQPGAPFAKADGELGRSLVVGLKPDAERLRRRKEGRLHQ